MTAPAVSFSHCGIHVTDVARMEDFYTRLLGHVVTDRGTLRDGPGYNVVNQFSFKLPTLADLKAMHARAREEGIKEFRIVTHGNAWSVYFADPEGNRVELFVDTPWHTPQPLAEPLDIEASVDEILARTEALCRSRPGFVPRGEWRKAQVERMVG